MQKAIQVCKTISKQSDKDCFDLLEDVNLHIIFQPINNLQIPVSEKNIIICYVIYAYDNDSSWLNLKQDRYDNKIKILKSLTDKYNSDFFIEIIENGNETINEVIGEYLIEQTTWKWRQIMISIDFHSNTLRFVSQRTETEKSIDKMGKDGEVKTLTTEFDIDTIAKVNKQKGELLDQALKARKDADSLLSEIKKEFVHLDNVVQADFGFEVTDEKRIDILSWRSFIKKRNEKKSLSN